MRNPYNNVPLTLRMPIALSQEDVFTRIGESVKSEPEKMHVHKLVPMFLFMLYA